MREQVKNRGSGEEKNPSQKQTQHRMILQHIQNILVIISAVLIITVILLELFDSQASLLCFLAYLLGAIAYGAEIVIIILRAKEHQVHRAEMVMPVIFGLVYILLAMKYMIL